MPAEADDEPFAQYAGDRGIRRYTALEEMLAEAQPELVLEGVRLLVRLGAVTAVHANVLSGEVGRGG